MPHHKKDSPNLGRDWQRFFIQELPLHLQPVFDYLSYHWKASFVDVGGGAGLVAQVLAPLMVGRGDLHALDSEVAYCEENVTGVRYIHHDARKAFPSQYDICFARSMLHYNTPKDQALIIKNMAETARKMVVLVQPVPFSEDQDKINQFYQEIAVVKKISTKHFCTETQITEYLGAAGLKINSSKLKLNTYGLQEFYQQRYSLSDDQIKKLRISLQGKDRISLPTLMIATRPE